MSCLRGVRDRFTNISRRYKTKISNEVKATGIGGEELTEYEMLLEDLIDLSTETDKKFGAEAESAKVSADAERKKGVDIRKLAMETMGESKKKVNEENEELTETKKRRSGGGTIAWLQGKSRRDAKQT